MHEIQVSWPHGSPLAQEKVVHSRCHNEDGLEHYHFEASALLAEQPLDSRLYHGSLFGEMLCSNLCVLASLPLDMLAQPVQGDLLWLWGALCASKRPLCYLKQVLVFVLALELCS